MEVIATVDKRDVPLGVASCTCFADGSVSFGEDCVQREKLLKVYVNDMLTMQVGCSEGSLVELVVGRLFTEGLIRGPEEIDCMSICDRSQQATVYLKDRQADVARTKVETVPTCCTMNRTFNDYFSTGEALRPVTPIDWPAEWVFEAVRDFFDDTPQHRATRGVHSCRLVNADGVVVCCEDIGRHNALDKAIGTALVQDIDLRGCLAFTSGRVPTDMAVKAVRAGIPVLATCKVATDKAFELADEYGLALVTKAGRRSFSVQEKFAPGGLRMVRAKGAA